MYRYGRISLVSRVISPCCTITRLWRKWYDQFTIIETPGSLYIKKGYKKDTVKDGFKYSILFHIKQKIYYQMSFINKFHTLMNK